MQAIHPRLFEPATAQEAQAYAWATHQQDLLDDLLTQLPSAPDEPALEILRLLATTQADAGRQEITSLVESIWARDRARVLADEGLEKLAVESARRLQCSLLKRLALIRSLIRERDERAPEGQLLVLEIDVGRARPALPHR